MWHRGFRKLKRNRHDFIIILLVSLSFRYSPLQTGSGVEVDREAECKIKWREFFARPEVATSCGRVSENMSTEQMKKNG
jgi:hypothetical protein